MLHQHLSPIIKLSSRLRLLRLCVGRIMGRILSRSLRTTSHRGIGIGFVSCTDWADWEDCSRLLGSTTTQGIVSVSSLLMFLVSGMFDSTHLPVIDELTCGNSEIYFTWSPSSERY